MKTSKRPLYGDLPPRYRCFLNPYDWNRFSSCPRCDNSTYPRKFALVIGVDGAQAPLILGLTCKYCSKCELIVAHKDVIEPYLYQVYSHHSPQALGQFYFIIATMDLAYWKTIKDQPGTVGELIPHMADIKEHLNYECRPAGWYKNDE